MKKIAITALAIIIYSLCFAQTTNTIEVLCQNALSAAENDDYALTKKYFDAVIAECIKNPDSDLLLNLSEDVSDYVILNQAKTNQQEASATASLLIQLQLQCLNYCANHEFFKSGEEYVNAIHTALVGMGYTLADAGLMQDAEDCLKAGISVFSQMNIFTEEYPLGYESMAYFYSKYKEEYDKELSFQYEGFKAAASLYGAKSELSKQIFSRMCTSYCSDLTFLSFDGTKGSLYDTFDVRIIPYDDLIEVIGLWTQHINEITAQYGQETINTLFPNSLPNIYGEGMMPLNTPLWDSYSKTLAAIHFGRMNDYERDVNQFLDEITDISELYPYSEGIITSLRNHNYVNYAIRLYDSLEQKAVDHQDVIERIRSAAGRTAYAYGFTDKAWSYVKELDATRNPKAYLNKQSYFDDIMLLAALYANKREYTKENDILTLALKQSDSLVNVISDNILRVLYNNLSVSYNHLGNNEESVIALRKAIEIARRAMISNNENIDDPRCVLWPAIEYGNLADHYYKQGNLDDAEKVYRNCLLYYETNNAESSRIGYVLDGLMAIAEARQDLISLKELSKKLYSTQFKQYLAQSFGMTKVQRTDLWNKMNTHSLEIIAQFALNDKSFSDVAYDVSLIQKGFLLKYDQIIGNNISNSDDKQLKASYYDFKKAESKGDKQRDALEEKVMYLYSKHPEFIREANFTTWQDVRANLVKGDAAIEFVKCCSDGKKASYAAIIIRPEWSAPRTVKLASENEMNAMFSKGSRAYYDNDGLYSITWGQLEPHLKGANRIFFSPDGVLSQMNIEILHNSKGKAIYDVYDLHRISSTANLNITDLASYETATLYGGLNYDLDTKSMQAISRSYDNQCKITDQSTYVAGDNTRKGWNYLPGTKIEVEQISTLLDKGRVNSTLFTADSGTEESFKTQSGHSAQIIHIATHGFYLNEKQAEKMDNNVFTHNDTDSHTYPLRRSGLLMSGGQHIWMGEEIPEGIDDGILTAEEIAGLNLSNTNLLVLSACQTGLGEIGGDGVYGLQRGFKIAGVGTIIMSLWEVDDQTTSLMMQTFYRNLIKGKSKRESFAIAQSEVRKKYDNPKYWAAFIMLD